MVVQRHYIRYRRPFVQGHEGWELARARTSATRQFNKPWKVLSGFPHNGCGYHMLAKEPIEIDHNINFVSDKSKHMAFKHSDWLETNCCMKIQNHLFILVSQEPLWYYESCFQESSSKKTAIWLLFLKLPNSLLPEILFWLFECIHRTLLESWNIESFMWSLAGLWCMSVLTARFDFPFNRLRF